MGAYFQNFFQKHIWDFRGSLENINTTINADRIDQMFLSLTSGEKITQSTALTLSAFYRGLRIHGDTVASLPKEILEPDQGGRKSRKDHDIYSLIAISPNPQMTSFIFYESLIANLFLYGNAFAEIEEKGDKVVALWPIESQNVEVKRKKREISYKITDDLGRKGARTRVIPPHKIIHIPLMGLSGYAGMSPIDLAGVSLGQGVALQNFVAQFFKNSAVPSGILSHEGPLSKPSADQSQKNWKEAQGGDKKHSTAVLPGNWKFQAIQSNAQEAQLNESREFIVLEVARWLGIEPHLLYDLRRATFSNIEEQNIQHTKFTVNGIVKRFEAELERKLFSSAEIKSGLQIRFNVNGLMRGDAKSRAEFYRTGIQNGYIQPAEVRALENLSTKSGADRLFIQQNMMPLDKVDQVIVKQRVNGAIPTVK